jgi:hypothetical protein
MEGGIDPPADLANGSPETGPIMTKFLQLLASF